MSKYSEALEWWEDVHKFPTCPHEQKVKQALRIADRLERGDVSEEMLLSIADNDANSKSICIDIFQTMAAQLLKEQENNDK